jgi:MoaA/NifB/PqqE/SkfB family radical SAM enzyme
MAKLPEQSLEHFQEGSRKLAKLGSMFISLAGGEPLIREDIVEIVRIAAEFHLPFITTHGWFVTPELAEQVYKAGLWGASVSIDYADPDKHDKARGRKGSFDRAVRALEYFSQARVYPWQRVNLMCVLLHDNLDQIEPLLNIAGRYNAYFMLQPYGFRKTGSRSFINPAQGVSEHLLRLKDAYPNFLSNRVFLSKFDQALNGGVPACRAGKVFFNIDSTGDIAICVEERHKPIANLYTDSAQKIVESLRAAAAGNTCTDCWYNCRGEVEMLYSPISLINSLPTYFFDSGKAPDIPCAFKEEGPRPSGPFEDT